MARVGFVLTRTKWNMQNGNFPRQTNYSADCKLNGHIKVGMEIKAFS